MAGATGIAGPPPPRPSIAQRIAAVQNMGLPRLLRLMRVGNMLCCIFQIIAGIGGVFNLIALNLTGALLSIYVILFGLLFLLFECRLKTMETRIRTNFGFLYSYNGRAGFIFFIGFLDFGVGSAMGTIAGILMCLNALFNLFVMLKHPEFTSGAVSKAADPTATYTDGKQEAQSYLQSNPQVVLQASQIALSAR
ncbi:unnamed protein product [Aphanomyces euteiches]|uniref:Golgi apparatus membrane protein TVP15 n=1 Tax=Aphanomyces euteiches TaxID=100861 RepID=A0A6G0WKE4_9STRA|nr:hypothetical protein Ae201684_014337 [Aphanomyces euteiches]KAH9068712.1 hypothetical protein Ae201684P_004413 [Aphanomyces euteiches]KAH9103794.1 hypothetical protein LEN26_015200 [Aphanomyces euteiches]KAH9121230.1 hypothetical protein AeMF1_006950 [Aphanomyces euteiches]KAH9142134.1 hypothetical protein AeRB84_013774 [Aphanomyces euteiches]